VKGAMCAAPCQLANVSVGKDPTLHQFWFPEWQLDHAFGGYWFVLLTPSFAFASQSLRRGSACVSVAGGSSECLSYTNHSSERWYVDASTNDVGSLSVAKFGLYAGQVRIY
jgi:hypothetical protein